MAEDDFSIKTRMEADVSNFERGMNKAEKSLKNFSKNLADSINRLGKKGLVGSIANVSLAMQGLTSSFNTAIKVVKDISKAVGECTDAYKNQLIIERALSTAIENNPFVTGDSFTAIKNYASEMQKVTNYGDDELIPSMTNLITLGRTEEETIKIMSVALDMSADGTMSLDTAITQLNATMNGNIGRLGQQNAELKNLTAEELKQGKAVEILGKKFKGLAQATVDTSKQLKNIKGDFKEAIGEFTLPSSDMWNKFWTGFYSNGIEVIKKFNDYLDTSIIGKQILENLSMNAFQVSVSTGVDVESVLSDFRYLKEQISYLSDSEIQTLIKTLEKQKERTEAEERMLTVTKQIAQSRQLQLIQDQKDAEAEAKKAQALEEQVELENGIAKLKNDHLQKIKEQEDKWEHIKTVTGEEVALEEKLKFYQDDLVAIMTEAGGQITTNNQYYKDQMAIINQILSMIGSPEFKSQWDNKLLEQRIEMLEKERDYAIENAEDVGEETYTIERYYNDKILELKLERLEAEREEALKDVGDNESEKLKIEEYYNNERLKILDDMKRKRKKKDKEEIKDWKEKFNDMLKIAKVAMQKVAETVKTIGQVISKVFNGIVKAAKAAFDIFSKIVKFNISDALDSVLSFEDAVLTFFVETLPKLPYFVGSVLQSIQTLFSSLKESISAEGIAEVVYSMLKTLGDALPQLTNDLMDILERLIGGAIDGLFKWLDEGGLKTLFDMVLKIQETVTNLVLKLLGSIATLLETHTGDLTDFLTNSIIIAQDALPEMISSLLRIINSLVKAVADMFKKKEFIDSFVNSVKGVIDSLLDNLPEFIGNVIDLIISIITAIAPRLPEIIIHLITKIVETIPKVINEIVDALGKAIGDIFSKIFTKEFWLDVFSQIGNAFGEIFSSIGNSLTEAVQGFGNVYNENPTVQAVVDTGAGIATGGLYNLGKWIGQQFGWWATGTNNAPSGLAVVGEAGPELVKFRGGEQVLNNRNTNKALANMGGKNIVNNITFNNLQDTTAYAMMQQMRQYNRQLAINALL